MVGRKFFLNVSKGHFFEKDIPGQLQHCFNEISGHLVNVTFKTTDKGEMMRLHVVDELNFYVLSFFIKSRSANAFFLLAKNLDYLQPMTFRIESRKGEDSLLRDFFSIIQNGGPVSWYYNQDNANELPLTQEGKRTFFLDMMQTEVLPALQKKLNPFPNHLFYKPAGKGLQGGYFSNDNTSVKSKGGSYRERLQGFGKSVNY